jgi:hypothetical protein
VTSPSLHPGHEFRAALAEALQLGQGFAAGKISISHIHRLNYSRLIARGADPLLLRAVEPHLLHHGFQQQGIFPADVAFQVRYNDFYVEQLRLLDWIGVFPDLIDKSRTVLSAFDISRPLIDFRDLEPDRSVPDNPAACYLPLLRGKRILIVCPFAELLASRANAQTFEGVWAGTQKRWFSPAQVDALEFPYGFEPETKDRYGTSLGLYDALCQELVRREFDVALIAAAGLAVPLATFIKATERVAIDVGGHLQVLFGVKGQRWREQAEWRDRYFNDWWIDMPDEYKPSRNDVCDQGAFW